MKSYVGTSGWAYKNWNPDGLSWYVTESGFNAIELNMSFYRFPKAENVLAWHKMTPGVTWVIKVNRLFTHHYRLNEQSFAYWSNFKKLFKPMDKKIAFYLFQLPPWVRPSVKDDIEAFFKRSRLRSRFALEWRHNDWWHPDHVTWAQKLGLTLVSVDAPDLPRDIFTTNGSIYLRTHGRKKWYDHDYTLKEIRELANKIKAHRPKTVYVFFNNDNFMLNNGRKMMTLLNEK